MNWDESIHYFSKWIVDFQFIFNSIFNSFFMRILFFHWGKSFKKKQFFKISKVTSYPLRSIGISWAGVLNASTKTLNNDFRTLRPHCFVPQSYNFAHDKYHEKWIETELIIDWFIFRWIVNYESIHFWNELNWMNQFIGFQNESWMWINSKNKWMDTGLLGRCL